MDVRSRGPCVRRIPRGECSTQTCFTLSRDGGLRKAEQIRRGARWQGGSTVALACLSTAAASSCRRRATSCTRSASWAGVAGASVVGSRIAGRKRSETGRRLSIGTTSSHPMTIPPSTAATAMPSMILGTCSGTVTAASVSEARRACGARLGAEMAIGSVLDLVRDYLFDDHLEACMILKPKNRQKIYCVTAGSTECHTSLKRQ